MKIFELERIIPSKMRRKLYRFLPLIRLFLLIVIVCLFLYGLSVFLPKVWQKISPYIRLPWQMVSIVTKTKPQLRNTNNWTNILLLGIGGERHTASDLTDSIIFVSINLEKGDTVFLSIPRDIWLDSLQAKINTAYHYGEEKKPGGGLVLAKATVGEIIGQSIHYGLVLDFDGSIKAIDLVGGVEVEVEQAFDDDKYPIPGKENAYPESDRYEHLHFDAGWQTMDGKTALKFARSRNAEGEEAGDFARGKRQQKVLIAFKNKIFSKEVFLSPTKIRELVKVFFDNVDTDIKPQEYAEFAKLLKIINKGKITTSTLDTDKINGQGEIIHEGLLFNPPQSEKYQNQWVLIPKVAGWGEVHQYIEELLNN